jgi:alpha-amylase
MPRILSAVVALLLLVAPPLLAQAQSPAGQPMPEWRRSGVCYEVFVRSFYDSDQDGVGDFRGLTQKLDHINDGDPTTDGDLGATCIWLMPIAPSPSYHGYDVTNYYHVNPDYGTVEDFRVFLAEAQRRGIHVVVDLVLNHLSSEHPIFRSALVFEDSPYRDWFRWSPVERQTQGWGHPTWHPVPGRDEYYYGLFWGGMPDYNLHNPEVTAKLKDVGRFWLEEMGVDGFRIDAVAHFFEGPEGEWKHWPDVHPWLRDYQAYLRSVKPDVWTIGEVWDGTDAILPYYPDQLDNYFVFEVGDALIESVRSADGPRLIAAVEHAHGNIPGGRWSPFLRNHDQTRTMTELRGSVPRAKLAASLLLTMPGFPFLYYGEEIGMAADKPDPRLRTPMHWELEQAAGFSVVGAWEPLQPDSFTANVAVQNGEPESLLSHYRRMIRLRAANPALGATGDFIGLQAGRQDVVAYLRRYEGQTVLVVSNLSERPISRLTLSSSDPVMPPGRHTARPLLGDAERTRLTVRADGRIRDWVALRTLAPLETYVLELTRPQP